MKIIYFLLLTMISTALVNGRGYAAPPAPDPTEGVSDNPSAPTGSSARTGQGEAPRGDGGPRSGAKPRGGEQNARGGAEKNRPRIHAAAAKPTRPGLAPEDRRQPIPANPTDIRSLARAQSGVVANRGSIQNEAIYRALPVRSGSVIRPATPSASPLRHRDPNPAVIGGAASSNSRSTASLDGTRTNLKSSRK